ncbi:heat shock factor-binding protein 1-like [Asparagus officinalis]|uniref:heat shock factor-binding protein 1-like n=1 Tax=Asparagus officinalis TaxID=4686 RepID=UPI00098E2443|nr:heat shock factor-binding protein 1-like [Asparagus officinalis]
MASNPSSGVPKGPQESEDLQSTADMTAFVQNLLLQMQSRFQAMSENIVSKIDEMGSRIDELEQSINDLKSEMGADTTPAKAKPDETNTGSAE